MNKPGNFCCRVNDAQPLMLLTPALHSSAGALWGVELFSISLNPSLSAFHVKQGA
jgi:hypothetical protein